MKVIKLYEASGDSARVTAWESKYNNAQSEDEKLAVVNEIFSVDFEPSLANVGKKLISFGYNFINNWLKAMKFSELANKNNDLINLFNIAEKNVDNYLFLKNKENFIKLYNVYASDHLIKEYFNDNNLSKLYLKLINNQRLYTFNNNDFKTVFELFDSLVNGGATADEIRYVFFEYDNGEATDELNQLPEIYNKMKEIKVDGNAGSQRKEFTGDDAQNLINKLIGDDDTREMIINSLKTYEQENS